MYILHPDFIAINVWLCTFVIIVSQWITLKHECPKKNKLEAIWINLIYRAVLNYNERIILPEQYFTTGQQPEWTNLINKESGTTYYNVSIVTPTLRMDHILHNRPTINMNCLCVYTLGQSNQRLLHWFPWRKNLGSMGSHTSTEQIMQLKVKKGSFYIAQYPVRWTAQSALHFCPPWQTCSFRHQLGFSGKHSSDAAITRKD